MSMPMPLPLPKGQPAALTLGRAGFRQTYLFDYNDSAFRFWLLIAGAGTVTLLAAIWQMAGLPAIELLQVVGWLVVVGLAAAFPLDIPRSRQSFAVGDVFIFLILALHGAAAAALATAVELTIASMRSSPRMSSRIASMANGLAAMYLSGLVHQAVLTALQRAGLPSAGAHISALVLAALFYFPASSIPLMQVLALKRGHSLRLRDWFADMTGVGALYLGSATVAGLLYLNAQQFGSSVIIVAVVAVGAALAMLRIHFRHQIEADEAQEARVKAAELDAVQNRKRFHAAFSHAAIGMAIVAPDGAILQVNQALCALLGSASEALVGTLFSERLHPGDAALLERHTTGVATRHDESFSIELRCIGAELRETWISLHCGLFGDAGTANAGLIFQLHDITSRRRAEGDLHHIAYHDGLTDLANRNCFHERLDVAVERHRGAADAGFAVMYLDLDRFKIVNDSLGHPAGDQLLKIAADRISACVRPGDLVARLGGDEFGILFEGNVAHDDLRLIGERLVRSLEQPVSINGTEVRPAASIGLTFGDKGYREADEVMRDADLAMYKAKSDGKGRLALFDTSLTERIGYKLQLEADLRRAIVEGQLSLAYQPLYTLEPYRLCGFEALARWRHPVRGSISPGVFIALAEETGCISALTHWAIGEAVRQHAEWRQLAPEHGDSVMHVNVSGKDLAKPDFVADVCQALERHGLPAHLLVLEITESTLMEHRDTALQALAALRALGVKLGIDDFGTGYSSLAYLSTLPFDCLKIDRSFVIGMQHSAENIEIVRTVIALGRSLNKDVVAEGIETHEQLQRLRELGATMGQGYLLSRPLTAIQIGELLQASSVVTTA
jgi:diguanylate cyclase (GGDEF)-like protein/PAS domain S-box-containing protein